MEISERNYILENRFLTLKKSKRKEKCTKNDVGGPMIYPEVKFQEYDG